MDPDQVKKLVKRVVIIAAFFAVAALVFGLGVQGIMPRATARGLLVAYVIIVGVLMVCAILLQRGKGGGLASIGGMSGDSLLGTRSSTPIAKATYVLAGLLLFLCLLISMIPPPPQQADGVLQQDAPAEPALPMEGAPADGEAPAP